MSPFQYLLLLIMIILHDCQVCVLGLVALLIAPEDTIPMEIRNGLPQVMAGAMKLLVALRNQQEEMAKLEAEGEEEQDEDDDDGDWAEGEDEDDGAAEEEEDAYVKRLERIAAKEAGALGAGDDDDDDDDDDSDDEWTDDEEEETPIDSIDPYLLFTDSIASLQTSNPGR